MDKNQEGTNMVSNLIATVNNPLIINDNYSIDHNLSRAQSRFSSTDGRSSNQYRELQPPIDNPL